MTETNTTIETQNSELCEGHSLEYYQSLQYSVIIAADEENEGYVATIPDLEGCIAEGETFKDAAEAIEEVR